MTKQPQSEKEKKLRIKFASWYVIIGSICILWQGFNYFNANKWGIGIGLAILGSVFMFNFNSLKRGNLK